MKRLYDLTDCFLCFSIGCIFGANLMASLVTEYYIISSGILAVSVLGFIATLLKKNKRDNTN